MAKSRKPFLNNHPDQLSLFAGETGLPDFEPIKRMAEAERMRREREALEAAERIDDVSMMALDEDPVRIEGKPTDDRLYYMSFGSGSSGNCSYIGDKDGGILIDAGIDGARVMKALHDNGIDPKNVYGIILTHDHSDHLRYAYSILRANKHMRFYCTPKAMTGLLRRHSISRRIKDYHQPIYKEFEFTVGKFTITPFDVSHDASDDCGFFIRHGNMSFAVATDLGYISERVEYYFSKANFLQFESNYDLDMLLNGPYPDYLKARIMADIGHLDNNVSARFISRIYRPELRYIFLCHLSLDNNSPAKALETYGKWLDPLNIRIGDGSRELNTDLQLIVLPRYESTRLYTLRLTPRN